MTDGWNMVIALGGIHRPSLNNVPRGAHLGIRLRTHSWAQNMLLWCAIWQVAFMRFMNDRILTPAFPFRCATIFNSTGITLRGGVVFRSPNIRISQNNMISNHAFRHSLHLLLFSISDCTVGLEQAILHTRHLVTVTSPTRPMGRPRSPPAPTPHCTAVAAGIFATSCCLYLRRTPFRVRAGTLGLAMGRCTR